MIKRYFIKNKLNIAMSLLAIIMMWLVWLNAFYAVKNDYKIPQIGRALEEFFSLFGSAFFWKSLWRTFLRTLAAFAISFALGAVFAVSASLFKPVAAFLSPVISVLRTLPTMAVLLLILVWTSPLTAPVVVTVLVLFPLVYSQLSASIGGVDKNLLEMARAYKVKKRDVVLKIIIPHMAPATVEQVGSNLSFGIKLTVSAEIMSLTRTAIGGLMSESLSVYQNMSRLAALTLVVIILGLVLEFGFAALSRLVPGKGGAK